VTAGWLARRIWRRLRHGKASFATLLLAFAAVAALLAGARALARQSALAAARLADQAHVIAYLAPGIAGEKARPLRTALARLPGVREVRETDGATALAHLRGELSALGQDVTPLVAVEADFLPASLEIVLAPGPDLTRRANDTAARLRRQDGIVAVDAMAEGLGRAAAFGALADRLAGIVALVALLASLALVTGLLLLERRRRRPEADTLALLGATPIAMRLPAGALAGFAAVLGGIAGLPAGSRAAGLLLGNALAGPPARGEMLVALACLGLAGLVAGWLSVPRPTGTGAAR
jgi:cell division protein FtsX